MPNDPHPIPATALAENLAIVGRTGSGKTYAAKGAVEGLLGERKHVVVVDPTGVWWGLRSSADGAAPGFPVIVFGGMHADVPVSEQAAAGLGEIIVERRVSCVLDVSEYTMAGRRRFLTDLLESIYARTRHPLHLVLDEADEVAPQRPMPDQTTLLHRAEQIVRRGRSRGLRSILITQRPAVLHKDVLSQSGTLIAMKLTAPQDRDALGAWIDGQADREQGKHVLATLPRLAVGEGWVWWPEGELLERRRFPPIATLDTSRAPDADEERAAPVLAPVDVAELVERLALPAPKQKAVALPVDREAIEAARRTGIEEGLRAGRAEAADRIATLERAIKEAAAVLAPLAVRDGILNVRKPAEPPVIDAEPRSFSPPQTRQQKVTRGAGAEMRILKVLAQRYPAHLTTAQWATLAGLSRRGGTWSTYVSRLRTAGYLIEEGSLVSVSSAGLAAAGSLPPQPSTPAEIRAMWAAALGSGPGRLMEILLRHPSGIRRDALADQASMAAGGGTFSTYLSRLRSNGLIEESRGGITLAAELRNA